MSTTSEHTSTARTAIPTPRNADEQGPDLTIFLIAHRVYRHEFGRLAKAAASAPDPKKDPGATTRSRSRSP